MSSPPICLGTICHLFVFCLFLHAHIPWIQNWVSVMTGCKVRHTKYTEEVQYKSIISVSDAVFKWYCTSIIHNWWSDYEAFSSQNSSTEWKECIFVLFSKIVSSFMRLLSLLHGRLEYFDGSIICIFMKMNIWYLVCEDGIYCVLCTMFVHSKTFFFFNFTDFLQFSSLMNICIFVEGQNLCCFKQISTWIFSFAPTVILKIVSCKYMLNVRWITPRKYAIFHYRVKQGRILFRVSKCSCETWTQLHNLLHIT